MTTALRITVDGVAIAAPPRSTLIEACDANGIYIPRLCYRPELPPGGECRLCTCKVNGRFTAACTTPVADGAVVENDTPELRSERRTLLEMLFVEGNHTCPACEKSGDCDLQAQAYRLGLDVMRLPYQSPRREIDASHPEIFLDRNTCILCGLCIRASRLHDHKSVFGLEQRGIRTRIAVNAVNGLAGTTISPADEAVAVCPVACIVRKRTGFSVPIGERRFDRRPIGAEIEARRTAGDGGDA